jgi:hypothetical protein
MEKQSMTEEPFVDKRRNILPLIIGGLLLVGLLAAAAFVAGRLLAPAESAGGLEIVQDGGVFAVAPGEGIDLRAIVAGPVVPASPPESRGLFIGRSDDTITIGTGNIMAISRLPEDPLEYTFDGIEVDVLVMNRTKLYEDITEFTPGQESVQQRVRELENLDMLGEGTTVQVWGTREGDRIVAETIVITFPN